MATLFANIRDNKGLGDAAVAVRLRNSSGQFYNFNTYVWDNTESANTRTDLVEKADSDTLQSLYVGLLTLPVGLCKAEYFRITTGDYLGGEMPLIDLVDTPNATAIVAIRNDLERAGGLLQDVAVKAEAAGRAAYAVNLIGIHGWDGSQPVSVSYSGVIGAGASIRLFSTEIVYVMGGFDWDQNSGIPLGVLNSSGWTKDVGWVSEEYRDSLLCEMFPSTSGITAGVLSITVMGGMGIETFDILIPNDVLANTDFHFLPLANGGLLTDNSTDYVVMSQATSSAPVLAPDYDAAKTAAQAGDQMDLVDAPNVQAVAAIRNDLERADGLLDKLKNEALGKWILNPTANTLTLYKTDGITILQVFNLGTPSGTVPAYISRTPQ